MQTKAKAEAPLDMLQRKGTITMARPLDDIRENISGAVTAINRYFQLDISLNRCAGSSAR